MSRSNPQSAQIERSVDVSQAGDELSSFHDQPLNIPLSSEAIFWPVRHPTASPFLSQLPFLFWLMETSRPRKVVQVGLGDGLIYMALCQAAERLGGQTFCMGIDPGDSPLPAELRMSHNAQYRNISTLFSDLPEEGTKLVRDADVLVLNSPLGEELSRTVLESWLPQLSGRAVVLVCDPVHVLGSEDLRRALLDEEAHPVMTGTTSPGGELLDVVLHGGDQPERLRRLASADDASPLRMAARQVFGRLGQSVEDAWHVATAQTETKDREGDIEALQLRLEQLELDLSASRSQIDGLQQELASERTRTQAAMSSELARKLQWEEERSELTASMAGTEKARTSIETALAEACAERDALRAQKADIESDLKAAEAARAEAQSGQDALRTQNEELQAEHAARIEDIAVLMRQHETQLGNLKQTHAQELKAIRDAQAQTNAEKEQAQAEIVALREDKNAMQVQYDEMVKGFHDSTSWRVTKPLRSLKLTFTR